MWSARGKTDMLMRFRRGGLKERDHLKDLGVDENIIIKQIFAFAVPS
jgi:hypothetical protein